MELAAVFDLDGVIRHFDPEHRLATEVRHGLAEGILEQAALAMIGDVTTGAISREEWIAATGAQVGSVAAAEEWLGHRGRVDAKMVALIAELRAGGAIAALLTNGTDTIPAELREFGLTDTFDAVFNSADVGVAKPDARIYQHVTAKLGVDAASIWFTDDTEANVAGARALGWSAELFTSPGETRASLVGAGLLAAP